MSTATWKSYIFDNDQNFIKKKHKLNAIEYIFNHSNFNLRSSFNDYNYILSDKYIMINKSSVNIYNNVVKYNTLQYNIDIELKNIYVMDIEYLNNFNDITTNILSWQFGMYEEFQPKNIIYKNIKGFWSKRECCIFKPYIGLGNVHKNNEGDIRYKYGSFQDGMFSSYINIIINNFIKTNNSDLLLSINILIDYLLDITYENGGIPEYYPLQGHHFDNICINDGAFVNYLKTCESIINNDLLLEKLDSNKIEKLKYIYNKSFNLLLSLQVKINNKNLIWAQQYNPNTLEPAQGRSFEPPELCSLESSQILLYLINNKNLNINVIKTIISGCEWFVNHSIKDYIQTKKDGDIVLYYNSNVNIKKQNLFSRYYSLETQKPVFQDRDGNKYSLDTFNNLDTGRRNGYTWLGLWGNYLIKKYLIWISEKLLLIKNPNTELFNLTKNTLDEIINNKTKYKHYSDTYYDILVEKYKIWNINNIK